ncbi:hypothetical protein [Streptomyces sp. NPDC051776]|uniref:hypothetical protein n=1 Tax=Streptomyces sp. NPDC051776 TaxID=3155414 RepID=UPI00342362AC
MKVGVIALPGCWDSGLTTVLDVLRTADAARRHVDRDIPGVSVRTVTADGEPVPTAGGLLVPSGLALGDDAGQAELDVLVIPAMAANSPAGIVDALAREEVQRLRGVRCAPGRSTAGNWRPPVRARSSWRRPGCWTTGRPPRAGG